jgi:polyphosphate kinase 2 (PPK2 family)
MTFEWTKCCRSPRTPKFLRPVRAKQSLEKRWKFSAADIAERVYWDDYMAAYRR